MRYVYYLVVLLAIGSLNLYGQNDKIQSFFEKLDKAEYDSSRSLVYAEISYYYYSINPDSGIKYGTLGLELAEDDNWTKGIAENHRSIGTNFWAKGDFDKGLEHYEISADNFKKIDNKDGYISIVNNKAIIYLQQGILDKAYEYFTIALNYWEEQGDSSRIAYGYSNIGSIYNTQQKFEQALSYFTSALNISKKIDDKRMLTVNYSNIGQVYENLSEYNKALDYYFKALEVNKELNNQRSMSINLNNIGITYRKLGEYKKAMRFLDEGLKINRQVGDKIGIAYSLASISNVYQNLGVENDTSVTGNMENKEYFEKALSHALEAADLAKELNLKEKLFQIYHTLSLAYESLGNDKEAFHYYRQYVTEKDSLFSNESLEKIAKLELQYEQEKEERAIEELKSKRDNLQFLGISIVIILLFISVFVISSLKVRYGIIDAFVFITFLLFYEFVLVLTESWIDDFTNEVPVYKFTINILIALLIIPIHKIERKLRKKFSKFDE